MCYAAIEELDDVAGWISTFDFSKYKDSAPTALPSSHPKPEATFAKIPYIHPPLLRSPVVSSPRHGRDPIFIGQGFETPSQVTGLLDILDRTPEQRYDMANAAIPVLWGSVFRHRRVIFVSMLNWLALYSRY